MASGGRQGARESGARTPRGPIWMYRPPDDARTSRRGRRLYRHARAATPSPGATPVRTSALWAARLPAAPRGCRAALVGRARRTSLSLGVRTSPGRPPGGLPGGGAPPSGRPGPKGSSWFLSAQNGRFPFILSCNAHSEGSTPSLTPLRQPLAGIQPPSNAAPCSPPPLGSWRQGSGPRAGPRTGIAFRRARRSAAWPPR